MKPLWSEKRKNRLLLLDDIDRRCERNQKLAFEMSSYFGENLLDKLPCGIHWWSWNKRLPNLIEMTFGNI